MGVSETGCSDVAIWDITISECGIGCVIEVIEVWVIVDNMVFILVLELFWEEG